MGSLQAQRAIQTRWWHHSQVLQGQSNSGLSSERLITNRLGFNKNSPNPAYGGGKRFLMTGQGFETTRLISAVVTVERLITSRLGFDAD